MTIHTNTGSDLNAAQATNQAYLSALQSNDPEILKQAAATDQDYLRMKAQEDGIVRNIIPLTQITPNDLDRQSDTVAPVKVLDLEPTVPGAVALGSYGSDVQMFIGTNRYRVTFHRIKSYRMMADVQTLYSFTVDLQTVVHDLLLLSILAKEDDQAISAVNSVVGDLNDTTTTRATRTGAVGYASVGQFTIDSLKRMRQGLAAANNRLTPAKVVINTYTFLELLSFTHNIAGDLATEMLTEGVTTKKVHGLSWYPTIKHDLVPNNVAFVFAAPKYLGSFMELEPLRMSTKTEDEYVSFRCQEMIGMAFRNYGAFCKVYFGGQFYGWTTSEVAASSA